MHSLVTIPAIRSYGSLYREWPFMRVIFTCAAVICWVLVAAVPAAAHVELTAASPGQDETVMVPVAEVRLEFSGALTLGGDHAVGVFGPGEQRFDDGQIVEVSDRAISTAVGALPEPGLYTVRWLVIGADGHAIEGSYTFTYSGPVASPSPTAAQPTPSPSAEPTPSASEPAPEPSPVTAQPSASEGSSLLLPIAGFLAGGALVAVVLARRRRDQG